MINTQGFLYPNIRIGFNKDLADLGSFPTLRLGKTIWGRLLDKNDNELIIDSLLSSPKFITYVEKTRQDFIKNHNNFHKYPKLDENDWK